MSISPPYAGVEYKICQALRDWQLRSDDGAFGEDGAAEAKQLGRPSPCILTRFAGFLDEFLLFDQAAKIVFVNQPSGQRLDAALQLQQREVSGISSKTTG